MDLKRKYRRKNCFVPGCKSKYRGDEKHISLFSPPIEMLKVWREKIQRDGRVLQLEDVICDKHFHEDDVVRFIMCGEQKVMYTKPRLKQTAVPCLFSDYTPEENLKSEHDDDNENQFEIFALNDAPDNNNNNLDQILEIYNNVPDWGVQSLPDSKLISFSKICLIKDFPYTEKIILINNQLNGKIYFGKNLIYKIQLDSVEEIGSILKEINEIKMCVGGPSILDYDPATCLSRISKPDFDTNTWRHKKCDKLAIENRDSCTFCLKLRHFSKLKRKNKKLSK